MSDMMRAELFVYLVYPWPNTIKATLIEAVKRRDAEHNKRAETAERERDEAKEAIEELWGVFMAAASEVGDFERDAGKLNGQDLYMHITENFNTMKRERDEARALCDQLRELRHSDCDKAFRPMREAEAQVATLRKAVLPHIVAPFDDDDGYGCKLCNAVGLYREKFEHHVGCPMASTAGRDLLARIEALEKENAELRQRITDMAIAEATAPRRDENGKWRR